MTLQQIAALGSAALLTIGIGVLLGTLADDWDRIVAAWMDRQ